MPVIKIDELMSDEYKFRFTAKLKIEDGDRSAEYELLFGRYIKLYLETSSRERAKAAAQLLREVGVDVKPRRMAHMWVIEATTNDLAKANEEFRREILKVFQEIEKSARGEEWAERLRRWREKFSGGLKRTRWRVDVWKWRWEREKVEIRLETTDEDELWAMYNKLGWLTLGANKCELSEPRKSERGRITIRDIDVEHLAWLSVYAINEDVRREAARFLKDLLKRVKRKGEKEYQMVLEVVERGRSRGLRKLLRTEVGLEDVKAEIEGTVLHITLRWPRYDEEPQSGEEESEEETLPDEIVITYHKPDYGFVYVRTFSGEEAKLIAEFLERITGVKPMGIDGDNIFDFYCAFPTDEIRYDSSLLIALERYEELSPTIQKWLELKLTREGQRPTVYVRLPALASAGPRIREDGTVYTYITVGKSDMSPPQVLLRVDFDYDELALGCHMPVDGSQCYIVDELRNALGIEISYRDVKDPEVEFKCRDDDYLCPDEAFVLRELSHRVLGGDEKLKRVLLEALEKAREKALRIRSEERRSKALKIIEKWTNVIKSGVAPPRQPLELPEFRIETDGGELTVVYEHKGAERSLVWRLVDVLEELGLSEYEGDLEYDYYHYSYLAIRQRGIKKLGYLACYGHPRCGDKADREEAKRWVRHLLAIAEKAGKQAKRRMETLVGIPIYAGLEFYTKVGTEEIRVEIRNARPRFDKKQGVWRLFLKGKAGGEWAYALFKFREPGRPGVTGIVVARNKEAALALCRPFLRGEPTLLLRGKMLMWVWDTDPYGWDFLLDMARYKELVASVNKYIDYHDLDWFLEWASEAEDEDYEDDEDEDREVKPGEADLTNVDWTKGGKSVRVTKVDSSLKGRLFKVTVDAVVDGVRVERTFRLWYEEKVRKGIVQKYPFIATLAYGSSPEELEADVERVDALAALIFGRYLVDKYDAFIVKCPSCVLGCKFHA